MGICYYNYKIIKEKKVMFYKGKDLEEEGNGIYILCSELFLYLIVVMVIKDYYILFMIFL